MVIDTSALLAILFNEPESNAFAREMENATRLIMSSASYLEAAMLIDRRLDAAHRSKLDGIIAELEIHVEPVTFEQAKLARQAFEQFGKGRHPAALNYGDCFTYALAKATREPLLFKGNDFSKTDLPPAVKPPQ